MSGNNEDLRPFVAIEPDLIKKFIVKSKIGSGGYGHIFDITLHPSQKHTPWRTDINNIDHQFGDDIHNKNHIFTRHTPNHWIYKSFYKIHRPEQLDPIKICSPIPNQDYSGHSVFAHTYEILNSNNGHLSNNNNNDSSSEYYNILNISNTPFGVINESAMFDNRYDAIRELVSLRHCHRPINKHTQRVPQWDFFEHDNVVRLYGIDLDPITCSVRGIIMEAGKCDFLSRQELLWKAYATFPRYEEHAERAATMWSSLSFIHHRGITHRDYKFANMITGTYPVEGFEHYNKQHLAQISFLQMETIKLLDFGLARNIFPNPILEVNTERMNHIAELEKSIYYNKSGVSSSSSSQSQSQSSLSSLPYNKKKSIYSNNNDINNDTNNSSINDKYHQNIESWNYQIDDLEHCLQHIKLNPHNNDETIIENKTLDLKIIDSRKTNHFDKTTLTNYNIKPNHKHTKVCYCLGSKPPEMFLFGDGEDDSMIPKTQPASPKNYFASDIWAFSALVAGMMIGHATPFDEIKTWRSLADIFQILGPPDNYWKQWSHLYERKKLSKEQRQILFSAKLWCSNCIDINKVVWSKYPKLWQRNFYNIMDKYAFDKNNDSLKSYWRVNLLGNFNYNQLAIVKKSNKNRKESQESNTKSRVSNQASYKNELVHHDKLSKIPINTLASTYTKKTSSSRYYQSSGSRKNSHRRSLLNDKNNNFEYNINSIKASCNDQPLHPYYNHDYSIQKQHYNQMPTTPYLQSLPEYNENNSHNASINDHQSINNETQEYEDNLKKTTSINTEELDDNGDKVYSTPQIECMGCSTMPMSRWWEFVVWRINIFTTYRTLLLDLNKMKAAEAEGITQLVIQLHMFKHLRNGTENNDNNTYNDDNNDIKNINNRKMRKRRNQSFPPLIPDDSSYNGNMTASQIRIIKYLKYISKPDSVLPKTIPMGKMNMNASQRLGIISELTRILLGSNDAHAPSEVMGELPLRDFTMSKPIQEWLNQWWYSPYIHGPGNINMQVRYSSDFFRSTSCYDIEDRMSSENIIYHPLMKSTKRYSLYFKLMLTNTNLMTSLCHSKYKNDNNNNNNNIIMNTGCNYSKIPYKYEYSTDDDDDDDENDNENINSKTKQINMDCTTPSSSTPSVITPTMNASLCDFVSLPSLKSKSNTFFDNYLQKIIELNKTYLTALQHQILVENHGYYRIIKPGHHFNNLEYWYRVNLSIPSFYKSLVLPKEEEFKKIKHNILKKQKSGLLVPLSYKVSIIDTELCGAYKVSYPKFPICPKRFCFFHDGVKIVDDHPKSNISNEFDSYHQDIHVNDAPIWIMDDYLLCNNEHVIDKDFNMNNIMKNNVLHGNDVYGLEHLRYRNHTQCKFAGSISSYSKNYSNEHNGLDHYKFDETYQNYKNDHTLNNNNNNIFIDEDTRKSILKNLMISFYTKTRFNTTTVHMSLLLLENVMRIRPLYYMSDEWINMVIINNIDDKLSITEIRDLDKLGLLEKYQQCPSLSHILSSKTTKITRESLYKDKSVSLYLWEELIHISAACVSIVGRMCEVNVPLITDIYKGFELNQYNIYGKSFASSFIFLPSLSKVNQLIIKSKDNSIVKTNTYQQCIDEVNDDDDDDNHMASNSTKNINDIFILNSNELTSLHSWLNIENIEHLDYNWVSDDETFFFESGGFFSKSEENEAKKKQIEINCLTYLKRWRELTYPHYSWDTYLKRIITISYHIINTRIQGEILHDTNAIIPQSSLLAWFSYPVWEQILSSGSLAIMRSLLPCVYIVEELNVLRTTLSCSSLIVFSCGWLLSLVQYEYIDKDLVVPDKESRWQYDEHPFQNYEIPHLAQWLKLSIGIPNDLINEKSLPVIHDTLFIFWKLWKVLICSDFCTLYKQL